MIFAYFQNIYTEAVPGLIKQNQRGNRMGAGVVCRAVKIKRPPYIFLAYHPKV